MKTLVLSLSIKDDSLYSEIVKMLGEHLKEKGINVLQQAGPGLTILSGIQIMQPEDDKEEEEKEDEEQTPEEPEPSDSDNEMAEPAEPEEVASEEPEAEMTEPEAEPEEMTVAADVIESEEVPQKEFIEGVRSFYLGNSELKTEKGVNESILFVENISVDMPYVSFKFKDTTYRYQVNEKSEEGTFIELSCYTEELQLQRIKCLLKEKQDQESDLVLGVQS